MAGDVLDPSGNTGWTKEAWPDTIEEATYQKMKVVPVIDESQRPFGLSHIRKNARISGSTLAASSDGTGLTYLNIIGTPITITPSGNVVPVAWSINEQAVVGNEIDPEAASNVEQALAELTEANVLLNVASLTQSVTAANVDAALFRRAYGLLMGNTNGMAEPGQDPQVYGVFSHTQVPALGGIPEFNQADVRGDSENPYVKGIWTKGGGVMLLLTTVVANDVNGWHNCLFLPSALVIAWNVRSMIKRDDAELQNRVIAYNHVGSAVKHDLRAVDIRTTDNPL